MTLGVSIANVANIVLDWLRGTAPASVPALYVKLHTGDPGPNGTANASVVTLRILVTMNAASGGQITLATISGNWPMTATETISHISVHDHVTAGNFRWSAAVGTPRNVNNGDTLTLTTLTLANTPLAA
jgi:hypothetical protein